jgi:hypothetical protein
MLRTRNGKDDFRKGKIMQTKYKHIAFYLDHVDHDIRKAVYLCANHSGEDLGRVEWYEPWKQYCYFNTFGVIYSQSCLQDIAHFLSQLNG